MDKSWENELAKYTGKDLIPGSFRLISAKSTDKVLDVLKLLRSKNIQCVPVYDVEKKEFSGLVDTLDILSVLVFMSDTKEIAEGLAGQEIDWRLYISKEQQIISEQPISELINASTRNPYCPVWYKKPLTSIMDMFSRDVNLHRIPIIHDNGEVIGMISQSKVIEFLAQTVPKFPKVANRKLRDFLDLQPRPVWTVNALDKALDAFRFMMEKGISGVAVVDNKGKLLASLSASDVKGSLDGNIFTDFYLPVTMYLEKCHPQFQRENAEHPVTCTWDDTIEDLLAKLTKYQIHRLFIVNTEGVPVDVISLCDIITVLQKVDVRK